LQLSAQAYGVWKDFQKAVQVQMRDGGPLCQIRDWGSKLAGAALRIASLLHVSVKAEMLPNLSCSVWSEQMISAVELCIGLISHVLVVFNMMSEDPVLTKSKRVLRWISAQPCCEASKRECFRAHTPHAFRKVEELDNCLAFFRGNIW
jgi:hypothetical protein